MAQLVSDDTQWLAVGAGEARGDDRVPESSLDPGCAKPSPAFDEDEVGEVPAAWMGSGPLAGTVGEPVLERFPGGVVDGDGSFVVELAERDPQPGAVGPVGTR